MLSMLDPHWTVLAGAAGGVLLLFAALSASVVSRVVARRPRNAAAAMQARVTELEATNREIEHTAFELKRSLGLTEEALKAKTQFLASMSHELRTPLNAIIGFSELLTHEVYGKLGDAHYRDYAQDIHDSGKHLLGLINDVLDLSKLDTVAVEAYSEPVDLAEFLHKTAQMVRPQADRGGIALNEKFDAQLPSMLTDERKLRQVLLNLLSNAVKFTAHGGSVTVSAYRQGTSVAIMVTDTGVGIAPEDIPKAMENYGQVKTGWSRNQEGTGLGMPLSKRLVELLGGSFVLESNVGVGTNIIVTFPPERLLQAKAKMAA
ncbi:MAG: sensor histidine kinase [Stellaceae bacterium]